MKLTIEIVETILTEMHNGRSLNSTLKEFKINSMMFYDFVAENPILSSKYARAQTARAELLVEELIDIADTEPDPQKARNRIDARKWYASKMTPHKYGDRIDLNLTTTVDIGKALLEAKQRVSLPTRYPDIIVETEKPLISSVSNELAAGLEPVSDATQPIELVDDIFD